MALDVHLVTPEREVWAGSAEMVIARGTAGMVGILSGHAPLLIRLAIGAMRIQVEGNRWETAVVDGGFLHVTGDEGTSRVDVLATHAEMANEIDVRAAASRVEELRARIARGENATLQGELAKALVRAELGG
ncbi:MAG TPA: ATP synthase F1 subunit epsilon [Actinomycetes bacterium]|jgi:F-type H+-transporting ATPase subunit epsilon|nr:ATP synthase F1 subunit epsilon [Actinomycetes bacterium]